MISIDIGSLTLGILLGIFGSWVYVNFLVNTSDEFDEFKDDT